MHKKIDNHNGDRKKKRDRRKKCSVQVLTHVVNAVQSSMGQRCPLLQPQVSVNEELGSGDGGRVLRVGQTLHHHCGHSLYEKKKQNAGRRQKDLFQSSQSRLKSMELLFKWHLVK